MAMTTVGLFGPPTSIALQRLEREVAARGARAACVDLAAFPEGLALSIGRDGVHMVNRIGAPPPPLRDASRDVRADELGAAYIARGEYMSPVPSWIPTEDEWASLADTLGDAVRRQQESRSVRASAYRLFSDTLPVVNSAGAHRACLLAPALLRRLGDAGLPICDFVSGNDLERIAYFVDAHRGPCRARRFGQPSSRDWPLTLDYLRDHHLDFDEFPLLVRRVGGAPEAHVLTVGAACAGAAAWDFVENRWMPLPNPSGKVQELAIRAARIAGLRLALVHIEQAEPPTVLGVDAEPDLESLEDQAGIRGISLLADLLLELATSPRTCTPPPGELPAREPAAHACVQPATRTDDDSLESRAVERSTIPGARRTTLRIGITGLRSNAEVDAVARAVEARGHTPVLLELPWFPSDRALHECASGGRMALDDLADLHAIFVRSTGVTSPIDAVLEEAPAPWHARRSSFCRSARHSAECFLFQYSVLEALGRRIPVINPPLAQEVHRTKVHQLFSLTRAGFPVPAAVAGNDRDACARFVAAQGGERSVVVKPLAGIYKTSLLSDRGLESALASGPVILQKYVRGDTIRAYIVGGRMVGAARSLCSGDAVDSSIGQYGVEIVDIPESVAALGWAAARHLGLSWTGMDFLRDEATGQYFILECNAAAMFAGFAAMTGFDVPGALADYLIALGSNAMSTPIPMRDRTK